MKTGCFFLTTGAQKNALKLAPNDISTSTGVDGTNKAEDLSVLTDLRFDNP
jgi:hypothetical protein